MGVLTTDPHQHSMLRLTSIFSLAGLSATQAAVMTLPVELDWAALHEAQTSGFLANIAVEAVMESYLSISASQLAGTSGVTVSQLSSSLLDVTIFDFPEPASYLEYDQVQLATSNAFLTNIETAFSAGVQTPDDDSFFVELGLNERVDRSSVIGPTVQIFEGATFQRLFMVPAVEFSHHHVVSERGHFR